MPLSAFPPHIRWRAHTKMLVSWAACVLKPPSVILSRASCRQVLAFAERTRRAFSPPLMTCRLSTTGPRKHCNCYSPGGAGGGVGFLWRDRQGCSFARASCGKRHRSRSGLAGGRGSPSPSPPSISLLHRAPGNSTSTPTNILSRCRTPHQGARAPSGDPLPRGDSLGHARPAPASGGRGEATSPSGRTNDSRRLWTRGQHRCADQLERAWRPGLVAERRFCRGADRVQCDAAKVERGGPHMRILL